MTANFLGLVILASGAIWIAMLLTGVSALPLLWRARDFPMIALFFAGLTFSAAVAALGAYMVWGV